MPTLEITTMIGCPLMCSFCPQGALKEAYGKSSIKYMAPSVFTQILHKVPKNVRIDFSGMSEPWANTYATEMLRVTLERGHRVAIYTTLYGMSVADSVYITTELLPKHEAHVEIVCLHLPDENMNMRGYKGSPEYREVLGNFLSMPTRHGRLQVMTMDRSGRIHPDLKDMIGGLGGWNGHSRAGSLGEAQIEKVGAAVPPRNEFALRCASTKDYDHNVLLPDGSVYLCCMDYTLSHKIGSLLTQEYDDLFQSEELLKLRTENEKPGFSACSICKSCENVIQM